MSAAFNRASKDHPEIVIALGKLGSRTFKWLIEIVKSDIDFRHSHGTGNGGTGGRFKLHGAIR